MASDFEHRHVYRKDERGVILESAVVGPDDEVPEGFEEKAEYVSWVPSPTEGPAVDESKLTVSEEKVDLRYTVDAIKDENEAQEGPSDPGGLKENSEAFDAPEDGPQPGDEVTADDGSAEHDADETVDETKGDTQEGPSDPGGEESAKADEKPRRSSGKK
jgi:hypothetical protein